MVTQPSREQLAVAIAALSSEAIRSKLQSNELTALGKAVAEAELARRAREGEPAVESAAENFGEAHYETSEFLRRPLGWSWGQWFVATGLCIMIVSLFGTTARNKADQSFLYAVILIQAVALAGIVRAVSSIFASSSTLGVLGKIAAVGILCFVLAALTLCSGMAQHGWGGG